jgi:hypothetical protein
MYVPVLRRLEASRLSVPRLHHVISLFIISLSSLFTHEALANANATMHPHPRRRAGQGYRAQAQPAIAVSIYLCEEKCRG